MVRQSDLAVVGEKDSVGASLQGSFKLKEGQFLTDDTSRLRVCPAHKRYDFGWFRS